MKMKITSMVLALSILLTCLGMTAFATDSTAEAPVQAQFYVAVNGNDSGDGSKNAPFLTIERAMEEVRKINSDMTGDIIINIGEGTYELEEELRIRPEDSGTNGFDVVFRGSRNNPPTISGGRKINSKWTEGEKGIWSTYVPDAEFVRDFFVDDLPGVRARSQKDAFGLSNYLAPNSPYEYADGFYAKKSIIGLYENPEDVELHWSLLWRDFVMHVNDIVQDPENEDQVIVIMKSHMWDVCCGEKVGGDSTPHFLNGFLVENAFELLDEPGEFYFNKKTKMLYYIPREGQDMNNAEAYYAVLDKILRVEGRDTSNHTHNVRFEDIRFAHATYSAMEETHLLNQQGEVPFYPFVSGQTSPSTINVAYSDNIDFTSCVFFGFNSNGVTFAEGVFDSNIEGCVFTDIGSSAFILGRWYIRDSREVDPDPEKAANVVFRKGWIGSHDWTTGYASAMSFINPDMGDQWASDVPNQIWRNEPWAKEEGILSWLRIDLEDAYALESIQVSFEESSTGKDYYGRPIPGINPYVSDEERSNFEILVSNDKKFNDYKVIQRFDNEPAPDIVKTGGTNGEKYRYIMLRKTVPGPFAITGVKAFSYDHDPRGNGLTAGVGRCKFENNYIKRVGTIHTQAPGLTAHYPIESSVSHNEIRETGYQGMNFGWGWSDYDYVGCMMRDNKINHNRIEDVMMQTHDGGGIYTLGHQPGTEYVGNVISDSHHKYAGFYSDYTSSRYTVRDTVMWNVPNAFEYYNSAEGLSNQRTENFDPKNAVKYYNTWSDTTNIKETAAGPNAYVEMEPIKTFTNHDMPDEVIEIMAKAGLEEKWHYIYDRVPQIEYYAKKGPDVANSSAYFATQNNLPSVRGKFYTQTANGLLKNGEFGNFPWQYDANYYYELRDMAARYDGGGAKVGKTTTHLMDEHNMAVLVTETYNSVEHLPYDEMMKLCDDALANARSGKEIGNYPENAIDAFKKAVDSAKAMPATTKVEKAVVVNRLETAYRDFANSCYAAEIIYCYHPDAKTEMDAANKTVTLIVPKNMNYAEMIPEFMLSKDAVLAVDLSKVDFSKGEVEIPIGSKDIGKYSYWKLIVKEDGVEKSDNVLAETALWKTNNPNTKLPSSDGRITLQPWWDAYMMVDAVGGQMSFGTNVLDPDPENGIHYIFSAQTSNLEHDGDNSKNTYYELVLKGYTAYLNRVDGGVVTEMAKVDNIDFGYGEDNRVEISVEGKKDNDIIKIGINGKTIFNHLTLNPIGAEGFFGVYSLNQKVEIVE